MGFCLCCLQPRARDWDWRIFIHNFLYFNSTCQIVCQSVWHKDGGNQSLSHLKGTQICTGAESLAGITTAHRQWTHADQAPKLHFPPYIINEHKQWHNINYQSAASSYCIHKKHTWRWKHNHLLEQNVKNMPNPSLQETLLSARILTVLNSHLQQTSN